MTFQQYIDQFIGDDELHWLCAQCRQPIEYSKRIIIEYIDGRSDHYHIACAPAYIHADLIPTEAISMQDRPRWMG